MSKSTFFQKEKMSTTHLFVQHTTYNILHQKSDTLIVTYNRLKKIKWDKMDYERNITIKKDYNETVI